MTPQSISSVFVAGKNSLTCPKNNPKTGSEQIKRPTPLQQFGRDFGRALGSELPRQKLPARTSAHRAMHTMSLNHRRVSAMCSGQDRVAGTHAPPPPPFPQHKL